MNQQRKGKQKSKNKNKKAAATRTNRTLFQQETSSPSSATNSKTDDASNQFAQFQARSSLQNEDPATSMNQRKRSDAPKDPSKKHHAKMQTSAVESEFSLWTLFIQIRILLWKNFRIFSRKKKIFLFMFVTPFMICIMMRYMQTLTEMYNAGGILNRPIDPIGKMTKCTNPLWFPETDTTTHCTTIGYSIIGDKRKDRQGQYQKIHDLMKIVADRNDLEYGKDVKPLTVGKSTDLKDYLSQNENTTSYAVLFCGEQNWQEEIEMEVFSPDMYNHSMSEEEKKKFIKFDFFMPCQFSKYPDKEMTFYSLLYNLSLQDSPFFQAFNEPYSTDKNLLALKLSLDNAILEHKAKGKGIEIPEIEMTYQSYPYVPDRLFIGADPVTLYGSFYLVLIPLSVYMIIYEEMIREKMNSLRFGLLVIGCSNAAFWISWMITGIVFSAMMAIMMHIVGYSFGFDIFRLSPFYIIFSQLFAVSVTYVALAAALTTMMSSHTMAYTISYAIILISVITTMALADAVVIYKIFYNMDMPYWALWARAVFDLLPSFHFSKLYGDIARITCNHMLIDSLLWVKGRPFESDDIYKEVTGYFATKDRYLIPPMVQTFKQLFLLTSFYLTIAWYFDNVLQSNRGHAQPFYFFLKPTYWFPDWFRKYMDKQNLQKLRKSSFQVLDMASMVSGKSINTAQEEKRMVKTMEQEGQLCNGVRIIGLCKTYKKPMFCGSQTHDVTALKNIYLELQEGELLGIMGHNGAGKSTLINVMSGLVASSGGNARIYDATLGLDLESIRKRMGIVSQFDVLWDELTGTEHMYLFADMKRVTHEKFDNLVKKRLRDVGLLESANLQVGKYSGGMRRRMSVALSTIGNPCLILMDEPTTGMDPVSRKQVWDLIQKMKKKRVVIMTTHAMEEAELLSDKLAVLNHGEVRCVGTPLQLKNLLGKGYRVNIVCNQKDVNTVKALMKTVVPSSEFYETSGDSGSLIYNVPLAKVKELGPVFKMIDNKSKHSPDDEEEHTISIHERKALINLKKLVKDVGVSQTTLEEVFMAATQDIKPGTAGQS